MLTEKENFLLLYNHKVPERLCCGYDMVFCRDDPVFSLDRDGVKSWVADNNRYYIDPWGTNHVFPPHEPGPMPITTADRKVISDITKWKEQLCVPDYASYNLDWSGINTEFEKCDKGKQLTAVIMIIGLFERTHYLMGFEDALINHLLYPDYMHELLDAILETRITQARLIARGCHPDLIIHHDDWGTKSQLFLPPDIWREFYKERYRKLFDCFRELGVIVIQHGDCYQEDIVKDMTDIGIRIWQGVIPENDIVKIRKDSPELILMGGLDMSVIDKADQSESIIRKEVRRACGEYGPLGNFIPGITYGGPGAIYPGVEEIIRDEVSCYNAETY